MNNVNEITKESLAGTLTSLISSLSGESDREARSHPAYQSIRLLVGSNDPEGFRFAARYHMDRVFEAAVQDETGLKDRCAIAIWLDWEFFERFLSDTCKTFYGFACSVDRARWILNSYVKTAAEGTVPACDHEKYWCPRAGTTEEWFALVKGIHGLRHGRFADFAMAWHALSEIHAAKSSPQA